MEAAHPFFRRLNCACDHFEIPSHLDTWHLQGLASQVCAIICYAQTVVWLSMLRVVNVPIDVNVCTCTGAIHTEIPPPHPTPPTPHTAEIYDDLQSWTWGHIGRLPCPHFLRLDTLVSFQFQLKPSDINSTMSWNIPLHQSKTHTFPKFFTTYWATFLHN